MRTRLTLLIAMLAVAAVAVPSAASAATLYTTAAHTTAVPVGTTLTSSIATGANWNIYSGGTLAETCTSGTLNSKVTQNSAGVFKAEVTGGTFPFSCTPWTMSVESGGALQVTGSSVANGTNSAWLGATLNGLHVNLETGLGIYRMIGNFTSATGSPPANGVFAQQPTAAKAPVSVILAHASSLTECPFGACNVSTTYTLTGTSAAYSLG
jgi:hypothetical protein